MPWGAIVGGNTMGSRGFAHNGRGGVARGARVARQWGFGTLLRACGSTVTITVTLTVTIIVTVLTIASLI